MKITDFFSLLGGLALFLYGMQMMSGGLEAAAGNKMKQILEKLTANRFLGILVGAGITAVIQSSSATTVMVVGFVNSGMMTLKQAVWIIMGANIGTTITGQLIALDIGALAPLFAFVGVALIVFVKKKKVHHYGMIIAGLGVLFIGMEMMSSAMMPLRESEAFVSLMTKFTNPLLGILAGAGFTAIIQSSSASVGYSAGAGVKRRDRAVKCSVRIVRTEHRYMYHRCAGSDRNFSQREAHNDYPSLLQPYRNCDLYNCVYADAAD